MKTTIAALCVALVLLCVAIHEHWQSQQTAQQLAGANNEISVLTRRAREAQRDNLILRKEADGLRDQLTEKPGAQESPGDSAENESAKRMIQLQFLARINDQKLVNHMLTEFIDAHSNLRDGFAGSFKLSSAEMDALNQAIHDARSRFNQLQIPEVSAGLTQTSSGLVVTVGPLGDEEQAVREELLNSFKATLGPERYVRLQSMVKEVIVPNTTGRTP